MFGVAGIIIQATGAGDDVQAVEFLEAVQVAESDGATSSTDMSGSFTPHANADFVLGIHLARNGSTSVANSAMSLDSVSMGAALSSDDGLGSNRTHIQVFGTSTFSAGTLAYTRSAGIFANAQLWGVSFRFVDSVGTPVKATGTSSPAQAAATPANIGDMLVVVVNIEMPGSDNVLTPINCVERLDLEAPDDTSAARAIGGLGTLEADAVAEEVLGFSHGLTSDNWTCHVIPLLRAT